MGADMIGFTIIKPAKGADKLAMKQLKAIMKVLKSKLTDQQKLDRLAKLRVDLSQYDIDYTEVYDLESVAMKAILEGIQSDVEQLVIDGLETPLFRDISARSARIGTKRIEIIFAGDLSWGDEPQGYGYQYLKRIYTLGISDVWENKLSQ